MGPPPSKTTDKQRAEDDLPTKAGSIGLLPLRDDERGVQKGIIKKYESQFIQLSFNKISTF